jgi:hypothetical protein
VTKRRQPIPRRPKNTRAASKPTPRARAKRADATREAEKPAARPAKRATDAKAAATRTQPRANRATDAKPPAARPQPRAKHTQGAGVQRPRELAALQPDQLAALRDLLEARIAEAMPARWNPDPEEVRRAVMKLVLTIVEFVRQLLERQAVRRMEAQTLTAEQVEAIGLALMRLEEAVRDLAKQSGLEYAELNLDLGPLGRLI